MELQAVMQELQSLGTEQNRKVYRRHGVGEDFFGVSFANLDKLTKRLQQDHALASQLWQSGNHDARMLATRIADPAQMDEATIEAWVSAVDNYILADALVALLARTGAARVLAERWLDGDDEWRGRLSWHLIAHLAMYDQALPDAYFTAHLARIASGIHGRKNRTRQAMNNALIAIGIRNQTLEQQAVSAAQAIGKVYVDHGETGCKTPDAVSYIRKARQRQQARANRERG